MAKTKKSGGVFLTPDELCTRWQFCISKGTLNNWRSTGNGPEYFKAGGKILYPIKGVLAFEKAGKVKP